MYHFQNKTAIVTGAASGMGLLFTQKFAELGGNVVMADINEENLRKEAEGINIIGKGKACPVVCDVRHYGEVCQVKDIAIEEFGSIDILVNFAGGSETRILGVPAETEFPDVPIEVYDWGMDVNMKAQFYFAHAVMKQMQKQKSGVIINIGSVVGEEGDVKCMAYSTAKSGVMYGLTKSLALYGAPYGIRCCCVSPGPVLTRKGMASMKTALGRAAEPIEIVDAILFLVSDKSGFTTGINMLIDGARVLTRDRL